MADDLALFCIVEGESDPFKVTTSRNADVDDLRKAIKDSDKKRPNSPYFPSADYNQLTLWRVAIPDEGKPVVLAKQNPTADDVECVLLEKYTPPQNFDWTNLKVPHAVKLRPTAAANVYGHQRPPANMIHIVVQTPPGSRKRAQDSQGHPEAKELLAGIVTTGPVSRNFSFMLPITDRNIFKEVFDGLRKGHSFVVHGPYQSGKTSLLWALHSELAKLSEVAVVSILDISSLVPSTEGLKAGQIIEALSQRLSFLLFRKPLGSDALDSTFQSLPTTSRCCILVDEFQAIFNHKELLEAATTFFRTLSVRGAVSYVGVGTFKLVELENQFGELDSPFNKATFLEMPPFNNSEMAKLFEMYKERVNPDGILQPIQTEIMLESSGHPASFMILLKLTHLHGPDVANWSSVYADNINQLMNGTHGKLKHALDEMDVEEMARVRQLTTQGRNTWEDADPDYFIKYLLNIGILIKHGYQIRFTSGIILRVCIDTFWPKT